MSRAGFAVTSHPGSSRTVLVLTLKVPPLGKPFKSQTNQDSRSLVIRKRLPQRSHLSRDLSVVSGSQLCRYLGEEHSRKRGKSKRHGQEARGHSVSEGQQESWRGWRVVTGTAVETRWRWRRSQLGWNLLDHSKHSELRPYM